MPVRVRVRVPVWVGSKLCDAWERAWSKGKGKGAGAGGLGREFAPNVVAVNVQGKGYSGY